MSKSLGNALDVDELLKDHGADVCRWWVASLAYENDVKGDVSFVETAGDSYRKVRNTIRFLLGNLEGFVPCTKANPEGMCVRLEDLDPRSVDAWILGEARALTATVRDAYARYDFRRAQQAIYDFCNDELSSIYCAATKDRLYCDRPDAPRRRATQTVMWDLVEVLARLLAPLLPHTADETFRALHGEDRCVHRETFADLPETRVDPAWPKVLAARDAALRALETAKARGIENPLDAAVVLPDPEGVLAGFARELPDLLGVSRVRCDAAATEIAIEDLRDAPRCERSWKRDETVRPRADGGMLSDRDAEAIGVA